MSGMGKSFERTLAPLRRRLWVRPGTEEAAEARAQRLVQVADSLYNHTQTAFDLTEGSPDELSSAGEREAHSRALYRKMVGLAEHDILKEDGSIRGLNSLYPLCLGTPLLESSENPNSANLVPSRLPSRLLREQWPAPSMRDRLADLREGATKVASIMY